MEKSTKDETTPVYTCNRDVLRDQIVILVKDFVNRKGSISLDDLGDILGNSGLSVYATLLKSPISFSPPSP